MRKGSRILSLLAMCSLAVGLPAAASADGLFFSEYIEGTSNNKALELFNATASSIDLGAGNYQVWMFFNGATTAAQQMPLSGTVASLDTYVFANPSADSLILAAADEVSLGTIWYNGDDAVALVKVGPDTTFIDVIGQIGFDPGSEWGTGDTSTQDNTIRRNADVCQGDPDGSDPFDPSIQWTGYPTNTFDGLGSHTSDCQPVAVEQKTWQDIKALYR